jgi:ATP-dependent DNA ligase
VFDVLAIAGVDLRGRPYWARREHLELLRNARPPLALVPATRNVQAAHAWLTEHVDAGIEGVVVKDVRCGYRPGRTSWERVRAHATVDAITGGVFGSLSDPQPSCSADQTRPAGCGWPGESARCPRRRGAS